MWWPLDKIWSADYEEVNRLAAAGSASLLAVAFFDPRRTTHAACS
jgi:hypothetical protein